MTATVPTHRTPRPGRSRHAEYDQTRRNPESKRFYGSSAWQRLRVAKLAETPWCESCMTRGDLTPAHLVHHTVEIDEDSSLACEPTNLESMCRSCHSRLHATQPHDIT